MANIQHIQHIHSNIVQILQTTFKSYELHKHKVIWKGQEVNASTFGMLMGFFFLHQWKHDIHVMLLLLKNQVKCSNLVFLHHFR